MKKNKVLLINTQFVELYVSGFTNRFIGLWCYLQKREQTAGEVHWVTNQSLWNKYFKGSAKPVDVTILKANLKWFRYTSRLFYPFYILYIYYRQKCTSIHVATSIIDSLYLVRLFNLFQIPYCFTFASNSLEMASYSSEKMKRKWQKLFLLAKNIEVLNPTNSINSYRQNKFVSPSSFPYLVELNQIAEKKFTSEARKNIVVFCGSFVPQKNPLFAIEGFKFFNENFGEKFYNPQLILIGRGELKKTVEEEVARINQQFGRMAIELADDKNLIEILAASKIFVSLQDYDNYPSQSLMEAMLFCNSVISFNNGDTKRLVYENYGNILLESKDPEELGLAIKQLLENWQLNLQNRELIQKKFSPRIFSDYFFDIHRQIANSNP